MRLIHKALSLSCHTYDVLSEEFSGNISSGYSSRHRTIPRPKLMSRNYFRSPQGSAAENVFQIIPARDNCFHAARRCHSAGGGGGGWGGGGGGGGLGGLGVFCLGGWWGWGGGVGGCNIQTANHLQQLLIAPRTKTF